MGFVYIIIWYVPVERSHTHTKKDRTIDVWKVIFTLIERKNELVIYSYKSYIYSYKVIIIN